MRTAKVLLFDPTGAALVLYRSWSHPLYPHQSDLPGGIIERHETYEDGLAREIYEETGIAIDPDSLEVAGGAARIALTSAHIYTAHLIERPPVRISWEHERYEWVPRASLEAALDSHDRFMTLAKHALKTL